MGMKEELNGAYKADLVGKSNWEAKRDSMPVGREVIREIQGKKLLGSRKRGYWEEKVGKNATARGICVREKTGGAFEELKRTRMRESTTPKAEQHPKKGDSRNGMRRGKQCSSK